MKRSFTGRHMLLTLVAFFGIVMAVNFTMARIAIGGFSGTVVDNSYIASQRYNDWLEAASRQADMGWSARVALDADAHVVLVADGFDAASVEAVAENPLRRSGDVALVMERQADGSFRSTRPLPAGRWSVRSIVDGVDGRARFLHDLRI